MEYFHVSNDLLNNGFELQPKYGKKLTDSRVYASNDHFHAQYLREMIIEDFRKTHFENKPSRLNSVYLFDDIRLALKFKSDQNKKYIYRVKLGENAIVHKGDMTIIDLTVRKSVSEIHDLTTLFYQGESSDNPFFEILCNGEIKIAGRLEMS